MYKIKICGIQRLGHLQAAIEGGASYVGFVFFEDSRRNVSIENAKKLADSVPNAVTSVALMVNPTDTFICQVLERVSVDMLQLHGHESIDRVKSIKRLTGLPIMKALGIRSKDDLGLINKYEIVADQILLDAKPPVDAKVPGGLGKSFDWDILASFQFKNPWLLAGGLTAKNVKIAQKKTGASQFDVSSGVEDEFGRKSNKKILEFLNELNGVIDE